MKSITNLMKGTHRDRRKLNQDNTEKKKSTYRYAHYKDELQNG